MTMFKWKKLGHIFDPQKYSSMDWMNSFAQAPSTLIYQDFVRVFFSCRPLPDEQGQYVSYIGYVDLDRHNLFKVLNISKSPVIGLGKRGTFDEFGTYPPTIIRHENTVHLYYGGWTRCASVPFNVSIGLATSHDDGHSFTKHGTGPVLSHSLHEPFIISSPKIRKFNNSWQLYYISGEKWISTTNRAEPVYKIRMALSSDGIYWNKINKNLIPSKLETDECQASPDVFFHNGKYHMFFCYRYSLNYKIKDRAYRIGYAISDDMVNWQRKDDGAGLEVSENGWDSEMVSYPHVFKLDNKIFMFYLGNDVGRYGFGLAQLESVED
jgi:predicted GH43/DUF377 family glycosyl hydrolase